MFQSAFCAQLLAQPKDFVNRRANDRGRLDPDKANVDVAAMNRNNRPTVAFKHNNKTTG
jgi:hypothetical protein